MQDKHNELSAEELKVISNAEFFKVKREITHKIEAGLAVLGENISELLQLNVDKVPNDILKIAPKISQGERYIGLPWLILDYPRVFSGEDVFAFRSMFWWGRHFSFTIHLSGTYFETLKRKLKNNISRLQHKDFYICVNKDQWQHHFEKSNYKLLDEMTDKEMDSLFSEAKFIKLSRKLPLNSISKMIDYGEETYREFIHLLS